jgi:hypothetical protein
MASPKIGRFVEKHEKSELLKAADNLAAQSRILRRAAEQEEQVLNRLRRLGEEFASEQHMQEQEQTHAMKEKEILRPLIEQIEERVADAQEARKEAKPIIDSLDSVDWRAIDKKLTYEHGMTRTRQEIETTDSEGETVLRAAPERFSTHNTKTRLAQLRAAANDLRPLVHPKSDSELRARLRDAQNLLFSLRTIEVRPGDYEAEAQKTRQYHEFQYAVNSLRQGLSYGSLAEAIRGKLAGVKKLLADIGADVLGMGSEAKSSKVVAEGESSTPEVK